MKIGGQDLRLKSKSAVVNTSEILSGEKTVDDVLITLQDQINPNGGTMYTLIGAPSITVISDKILIVLFYV